MSFTTRMPLPQMSFRFPRLCVGISYSHYCTIHRLHLLLHVLHNTFIAIKCLGGDTLSETYNKALTLEDRKIIETGIRNGSMKVSIAQTLGKEKSTIGKEIKLHRFLSSKCSMPLECSAYKKCRHGRNCSENCKDYVPFKCNRRDRSPGACNGCSQRSSCRFNKYVYEAIRADAEYRSTLVDSREGVNLTTAEAKEMADIIKPLLEKGQSPYQIITDHPELGICEKTLYNYIDGNVFSIAGVGNIDLRRKTSRKMPKKRAASYKKREDRSFLKSRLYTDYQNYMRDNPNAHVVQMDTVYNDVSNGPFIQTFKFIGLGMLIALFHEEKTAAAMKSGIDTLDMMLGSRLFNKYAEVVLTDRGAEFTDADGMELRDNGSRRTRVFYCDPMQSGQKGSLEENHEQLRYILPKETNLRAIGLVSQDALNLAVSHVNSAPVESLNGKSPVEYTRFMAPGLWKKLMAFGICEIPRDDVTLKPYLLKSFIEKT